MNEKECDEEFHCYYSDRRFDTSSIAATSTPLLTRSLRDVCLADCGLRSRFFVPIFLIPFFDNIDVIKIPIRISTHAKAKQQQTYNRRLLTRVACRISQQEEQNLASNVGVFSKQCVNQFESFERILIICSSAKKNIETP